MTYVNIREHAKNIEKLTTEESKLLLDETDFINFKQKNLYQISFKLNTSEYEIVNVGVGNVSTDVKIKEFSFGDHTCTIRAHVYTDDEIKKQINDNLYTAISLLITASDNKPIANVSFTYNFTSNKFEILLKEIINNLIVNKKVLYEYNKYPGNNNVVETLIKFLTNDSVVKFFI